MDMSVDTRAPVTDSPRVRAARLRDSLAATFPSASGRPTTKRALLLGALAVAVGTVVSLLRIGGTGALQTIFEEDAGGILTDALSTSAIKAITRPISGYYLVGPRLIGELATIFPISWAAPVMSLTSAIVVALLTVQVYVASGAHLSNRFARFLVAAPMLAAPAVENRFSEVYNRPVCLHFFAMYALFWVLLWTPTGRWGRFGALFTIGMTGLSTILIIGYVPLAAARFALRRDRYSGGLLGLALLGTAVQLSVFVTNGPGRESGSRFDPIWAAKSYVGWAMPNSLFGMRPTEAIASKVNDPGVFSHNIGVIAVAWLVVAAIVAVAAVGARLGLLRPRWGLALLAGAHSVWLLMMMVMALGHNTQRYLVAPELLLFAALVLLLLPAPDGLRWRSTAALAVFTAFLAVVVAINYRWSDTYRSHSPAWSDTVRQASAACDQDQRLAAVAIRNANPPLASWATIPCHDLRGGEPTCNAPACRPLPPATPGRRR